MGVPGVAIRLPACAGSGLSSSTTATAPSARRAPGSSNAAFQYPPRSSPGSSRISMRSARRPSGPSANCCGSTRRARSLAAPAPLRHCSLILAVGGACLAEPRRLLLCTGSPARCTAWWRRIGIGYLAVRPLAPCRRRSARATSNHEARRLTARGPVLVPVLGRALARASGGAPAGSASPAGRTPASRSPWAGSGCPG
jgi:hypothetical protein